MPMLMGALPLWCAGVLLELLQNADDAGATKLCLLLDTVQISSVMPHLTT